MLLDKIGGKKEHEQIFWGQIRIRMVMVFLDQKKIFWRLESLEKLRLWIELKKEKQ